MVFPPKDFVDLAKRIVYEPKQLVDRRLDVLFYQLDV
jgi:hypothetical protein